MHTSCRKDPNSTESVEEAALKASGPMPCALLIVTSAFLSSNSDWWVCQGGGVFFRGDRERMVVKNSVLKSHLSCQKADTGHPGTRGLWCSESGQWPSFTPPPLLPSSPIPSYNIPPTTTLLSFPISSVLYCHPALNELPFSSPSFSFSPFALSFFHFLFLLVLRNLLKPWYDLSHFINRHKTSAASVFSYQQKNW